MYSEKLRHEPRLEVRWTASGNALASLERARQLLELIHGAHHLRPEVAVGKFAGPFEPSAIATKAFRATARGSVSLVLRGAHPDLEYKFFFNPEFNETSLVANFLLSEFSDEARCDELIGLLRALADTFGVEFARAHDDADADLADAHRERPLTIPPEIDDVYWLTLWGKDLVDRAGRARTLSTPGYRVQELAGGAVLLLTRPTPIDARTPEARRAQARALAHLHPRRSEDELYAELMKRSQHLAPVEIAWDDDVGPLFQLFTNDERQADRPSMIARFNARTPPPVEEIRDAALPAQGDVEDALDDYDDRAEQLVALLQKQVPDVETFEPRVVPNIDYWCWRLNFAEDYERRHVDADLVPALGAYVALVMVRHLGGTLVPRKRLDESQVVVGGRVYLPFLRARHQLASREDAIDHSITQFLAVAKRGG